MTQCAVVMEAVVIVVGLQGMAGSLAFGDQSSLRTVDRRGGLASMGVAVVGDGGAI